MLEGGRHGGEDSIGGTAIGAIASGAMDAIVFDWDGTLCDSLPAIYEANRIVLEEPACRSTTPDGRAAYVPDWRLMYQRLGVPDGALDEAGRRWLALYAEAAEAGLLRACGNPSSLVGAGSAGPRDRRRPGRSGQLEYSISLT